MKRKYKHTENTDNGLAIYVQNLYSVYACVHLQYIYMYMSTYACSYISAQYLSEYSNLYIGYNQPACKNNIFYNFPAWSQHVPGYVKIMELPSHGHSQWISVCVGTTYECCHRACFEVWSHPNSNFPSFIFMWMFLILWTSFAASCSELDTSPWTLEKTVLGFSTDPA